VLMIARPNDGTMNTQGQVQDGDMAMIGVAWERDLSAPWFLELSVVGSMGGAGDGYAQGLCDLGVRLPLSSSLDLVLGGGAGLAGGGKVDTGGGLVADGFAKFEQALGLGCHFGVGAGVVGAVDGDFLASRLHVDLGYAFESPVPTGGWRVPGSQVYRTRNMRVRLVNQTEVPPSDARRKDGLEDKTINLAGLKADAMISRTFFVTGQVLSAYDGGAGGYAVGLAGFGAEWPRPGESAVAVGMEALIGAAGGGGIDVEGGLVTQATAGVGYRLGGATGLWLRYGRSGSIKDVPDRDVISAEFTFRFSTLMR